jgi:FixJ family two-component response regulator
MFIRIRCLIKGFIDLMHVPRVLKGGAIEVLLKPCPAKTLVSSIEKAYESKVQT